MDRENNIICSPKNESFLDFLGNFKMNYPEFLEKNVIVDLTKVTDLKNTDILLFFDTAKAHLEKNTSFVVINAHADPDQLPEEIVTAPTLLEAIDIIELDEISRDLGF